MTVIAYHLIWTAYGTWLPNDPRGSGSTSVNTPELAELGDPHFGRKRVQPSRSEVKELYSEAAEKLSFPIVRFDEQQRHAVGESFLEIIHKFKYTCYACAIMPDHVHLVIRKHRDSSEQMIRNFQGMSRAKLLSTDVVPTDHPVWTKRGWKVVLEYTRGSVGASSVC